MTYKLALLDIDGVIADDRHRVAYAVNQCWTSYFHIPTMAKDDVWPQGRDLYQRCVMAGYEVAYMTGRRTDRRDVTVEWLGRHGFPTDVPIFQRKMGDRRRLAEVKASMIDELWPLYDEIVLFDDDPEVCRLVRYRHGDDVAVHCTWHVKEEALVRRAVA